jgi:hypothetical protein
MDLYFQIVTACIVVCASIYVFDFVQHLVTKHRRKQLQSALFKIAASGAFAWMQARMLGHIDEILENVVEGENTSALSTLRAEFAALSVDGLKDEAAAQGVFDLVQRIVAELARFNEEETPDEDEIPDDGRLGDFHAHTNVSYVDQYEHANGVDVLCVINFGPDQAAEGLGKTRREAFFNATVGLCDLEAKRWAWNESKAEPPTASRKRPPADALQQDAKEG